MEWTLIISAVAIVFAFGYSALEIDNHPTK